MTKPVLVTLHGFLGSASSFNAVVNELEHPFEERVAVTISGHDGETFGDEWRWSDVLDVLAQAIKYYSRVVLMGYSMGARLALGLALERLTNVDALVLVGAHPGIATEEERVDRRWWEQAMTDSVLELGVDGFAKHWESLPLWDTQRRLPEKTRSELAERRRSHQARGIAWAMQALGTGAMPNYRSAIAESTIPMLWITGELDEKFRHLAVEQCARNDHCKHVEIAGVGHDCTLEAPVALAGVVDQWLLKGLQE